MSKLIYEPAGRAHEFSPYACNLYKGCTNRCDYCYNRLGVRSTLLGADTVSPKKDASLKVFKAELLQYKTGIIASGKGLFFSFVSDPCLPDTVQLTWECIRFAVENDVPCVVLTKRADFLNVPVVKEVLEKYPSMVSLGWTLTGVDSAEPYASPTDQRIACMKEVHYRGIRTWASLEPMLSLPATRRIIRQIKPFCDHFKCGPLNGHKRSYSDAELVDFYNEINALGLKDFYWKDNLLEIVKKATK